MHELIRLTLPARKVPTGRFVVSEDNEFLIVFKDCIGLFFALKNKTSTAISFHDFSFKTPNLSLTGDKSSDSHDHIGSRMKFFFLPETIQSRFPITLAPTGDVCSSPLVARYALSCCERAAIAMSTKSLESKDFLTYTFRNAAWSPPGVDKNLRTGFSCVTGSRQLLICLRDLEKWTRVVNLSNIWNVFWKSRGLAILNENHENFLDLSNELNTGTRCEAGENTASPLECRTVQEFLSSIAESSFMTSTWSQRLRRSEQKSPHCNALLVSLHKSGSISFWDVALPLLDGHNVRLAAVDRTYTATFDPPTLKARLNFLKSADLSGEYFLLVIAFTDGRVRCATYQAYAREVGVLAVTRVAESELCPPSGGALCVGDVACTNGLLAVAYGTRVLLARVLNHSSVQLLTNLSDDAILKAISGVQIFSNCVYFSSQDGVVARASIPTQMNKNSKLTILTEASTQGGTDFHRFFGGLHLTKNGVYAVFVESTVAPAFCHVTSNLVFMSLLPSSKVVEMIDKVSAPMRKNADCLYEVKRLLRRLDCGQMLSPEAATGEGGGETWSKNLLAFCAGDILTDEVDLSTMELHKIQFRRAVAVTLLDASAKSPDVAQKLQTKIGRLDRILALRQVDHCYRLFLKTEVQRQAQDCILVLRIAALCRRFLQSRGPTEECDASALCTMLHRATEAVTSVAEKLLTRRFEHSLEGIRPEALLVCPVCRDEFDADLLACACPKGHKFLRCASTFVPCVDPSFNECPSCRRCSVLLPDRPSQWRKEINGRFCPYCNVRFCIVVL